MSPSNSKTLIFILGGARSGKSAYAQQLAARMGERVLFVATATAGDEEMAERIARHRAARPAHWRTLEVPTNVGEALREQIGDAQVVLLDCLSLWVANLMGEGESPADKIEAQVQAELEDLLAAYEAHQASLIVVSNEVGMGLVPVYPLGRLYRDVLGRANQWIAAQADQVILMVAGLPVQIKG
ncbi:MAG: bifunctional adenosylcobinamide kinase/adenosylcobinamide-phosphate guanylyltransferase [Anaerolineae bacterium]|nr:bifunctional adenosylcobinamide kinase/adenosylcobinamide-phosphate guanylyltransferase [Anaerolineae bacterium]MCX8066467.1 bifunctional adenosylcobinamide kinase/adenosylcobinamide-phosphate guanylyltransferase [Anaerolineae bacterium]